MSWVVVDLEATCWRASEDPALAAAQREHTEIIEIGAVRFEPSTREISDQFKAFVRPTKHPKLSSFCTELTHIRQEDLEGAPPLSTVYGQFIDWIGPQNKIFAAWGAFDHHQFARENQRLGLPAPTWQPYNVKAQFSTWIRATQGRRRGFGLSRALTQLGWTFEGTPHRAYDDAYNVARVLQHLRDPANLSDPAKRLLAVIQARRPEPTHVGHLRGRWPDAKRWWRQVGKELETLDLVELLPNGRGYILRGAT